MQVAVYHNNLDIRIEERECPSIGPGEVLLRVEASGICGSDVMEWYRVPCAPLVLGHEITGTVEKVGIGVEGFRPGDRVFATHHVPCGDCARCRGGHPSTCETLRSTHLEPGGFAQFARVPALQVQRGMLPLPAEMSFEDGSFIEPLACAIQAQRHAAFAAGQSVLILGSGMAGLLHLMLARAQGAEVVITTDLSPYRLDAARSLGADAAWDAGDDIPGRLQARQGRLADRVIVCTPAPAALEQAFQVVEPGGQVLCFAPPEPGQAVEVPVAELWRNEVTLCFSYAASGRDLERALNLIHSRAVEVSRLITHRLPLREAPQGFHLTASAGESLKVVLFPHL